MWSRLHVRWGNPPHVTSPTWGPPPSCKQALRVTQMGDGENEFVPRDQIFPLLVFYCSLFLPKISSFTLVLSIRINLDSIYLLIFYFEKLPPWIWHPFNVNMTLNLSILMTRYSNRRLDVMGARKNGAREGRGPWKCFFFFFRASESTEIPILPSRISPALPAFSRIQRELKLPRRRRLRKRHLKSEVALLQTLSRLFHLVQFVKCW